MAATPTGPGRLRLTDPVQLLALGLGSGLSPWAPGTVGTLAAVPFYLLLVQQPLWVYTLVTVAAAVAGVWICGHASRALGVHDHSSIVWDEFVGLWIALWAVPSEPSWVILGFVVFRVFDIAKPWPVGWLDRHSQGGFGIMIDDLAAGVMTCMTLHIALHLTGP